MRRLPVVLLILILFIVPTVQAQTDQRCFAETNQCISGRIRTFWEQNGSLPVFGFPTGPQQDTMIEGKPFQAQTFERNRLELHPENQRPYDVLLGRLGVDRLAQQGRDWNTFPKAEAGAAHYYAQTGHAIAPQFWGYRSSHGLEFDGKKGASEAESLALFGLPLSEPAMETNASGATVLTQWFERARFEAHPENKPPYDVLLGLLGNELQSSVDGSPPPPPPASQQIKLEGKGKKVTDPITLPSEKNRVMLTHAGSENFAVWVYFPDGSRDLLVNEIGHYQGSRPIVTGGQVYFEIDADGAWSLTIEALGPDNAAAGGISGHGATVSGLFAPTKRGPVPYSLTHNGSQNFAVWLYCGDERDLIENEIGAVNDEVVVTFTDGPCFWEVEADGDWSVKPK